MEVKVAWKVPGTMSHQVAILGRYTTDGANRLASWKIWKDIKYACYSYMYKVMILALINLNVQYSRKVVVIISLSLKSKVYNCN